MARRGENIYKRSDGRWEGRYISSRTTEGKAIYKSVYAKSYTEIKSKLAKCRNNDTISEVKSENTELTEYASDWLLAVKMKRKISTYNKYKNIYETYIKLNISDCREFDFSIVEKIMLEGAHLSPKTQNSILSVVKLIYEYAISNGFKSNFSFKGLSVSESNEEIKALTIDEQKMFTDYLLHEPDLKKIGVYLCLFTGMRIGELCALRYENFSFDKGIISIRKTMQRVQVENKLAKTEIIITEPKSKKSIRDIPLPKALLQTVEGWYKKMSPADYILTGRSDKYIEPRSLENYFIRYIRECGIKDVNFHILRHTFATRCIEAGFDVKTLSEILGHSNVNITLNRYVHSSIDLKRRNMEKLSQLL